MRTAVYRAIDAALAYPGPRLVEARTSYPLRTSWVHALSTVALPLAYDPLVAMRRRVLDWDAATDEELDDFDAEVDGEADEALIDLRSLWISLTSAPAPAPAPAAPAPARIRSHVPTRMLDQVVPRLPEYAAVRPIEPPRHSGEVPTQPAAAQPVRRRVVAVGDDTPPTPPPARGYGTVRAMRTRLLIAPTMPLPEPSPVIAPKGSSPPSRPGAAGVQLPAAPPWCRSR